MQLAWIAASSGFSQLVLAYSPSGGACSVWSMVWREQKKMATGASLQLGGEARHPQGKPTSPLALGSSRGSAPIQTVSIGTLMFAATL